MEYGGAGGNIDPSLKGKFGPGPGAAATGSAAQPAGNFQTSDKWKLLGRENRAWGRGYLWGDSQEARDEYEGYLQADYRLRMQRENQGGNGSGNGIGNPGV
jgi:hypothetical protein